MRGQTPGHGIRRRHLGIGKHFNVGVIVAGQQRQQEATDDMVPEVRRNVADPQPPVGRRVVVVAGNEGPERLGVQTVPFLGLAEDGRRVVAGMILQGTEQIAMGLGESGLRSDGARRKAAMA